MLRTSMAWVKLSILAFCLITAVTFAGILYFLILRVQGGEVAQAIGPFTDVNDQAGFTAFIVTIAIGVLLFVLSLIFIILKLVYARTSNRQFYLSAVTLFLVAAYSALLIEIPSIYVQYSTVAQWFIIGGSFVVYLIFASFCVYEWRKHEVN